MELQKDISEPLLHRAVFEAATLTVHSLLPGEDYDNIDRVFIIFVMEQDLFGRGSAIYRSETKFTDGGTEITAVAPEYIFVNGAYKDSTNDLGRVIHDITERDPRQMMVPELRERADQVKNIKEGKKKMSAALDAYTIEVRKEQQDEIIRRMLKAKQTPAFIAEMLGISVEQVEAAREACSA